MNNAAPLEEQIESELLLEIRSPWWLKSDYGAARFLAEFSDEPSIDMSFDIRLADGRSLASPQATQLRHEVFDFLCLQAHPTIYGRRNRSSLADKRHLLRACRIVDHLLLRDTGKIARAGLASVGKQDLAYMLVALGRAKFADEGMYEWHTRLTNFLREKGASVKDRVQEAIDCEPGLGDTTDLEDVVLGLDYDELVRARAFVYWSTLEATSSKRWNASLYEPANTLLRNALYSNTLLGPAGYLTGLRLPSELHWSDRRRSTRELPGVAVAAGREDQSCSIAKIEQYRLCLLSGRVLSGLRRGFSHSVLDEASEIDVEDNVTLKPRLGFNHVPPPVVADVLRKAIVFFYDHHEHLLQSLRATLTAARGVARLSGKAGQNNLPASECLDTRSAQMGINVWSIPDSSKLGPKYAAVLRGKDKGLWDMVQVLYGACLVIVGVCQAGRQGELLDIRKRDINETRKWLALMTRKSGYGNARDRDFRPTPKVASDVIDSLSCLLTDVAAETDFVFAIPTITGLFRADVDRANQAIDTFLDFIEAPTDPSGRRYYLRQHQLRKFFASVFFHCCSFAGLDTLRWFLRQRDTKHLWAYIRGITPGSEMRHHMATAGALLLRDGASEMDRLANFLRQTMRVSDLSIISDDEMVLLLERLQAQGTVEFDLLFSDDATRPIRLGVFVSERSL